MFFAAGCLQHVSTAAPEATAGKLRKYALPPVFPILQSVKRCSLVEVTDLGEIQRKLTEDLFSMQQLRIVISRMDTPHL